MTRSDGPEGPAPAEAQTTPEDPAYYEALGRAIKVARTQFGWDRKDLANLANVSYAYLSDIETGRGRPGSRSLFAIAAALGRTPAELMAEAESYHAQITDEALQSLTLRSAIGPSDGPDERRKIQPSQLASTASTKGLRDAWRRRLETSQSSARKELHKIVEDLPREDLDALLEIARRLISPHEDAPPPRTG